MFCLQDDLLYESLTVWETLWYAAQLRLPRTMTKSAKKDRVTTVIAALGLTRCRDTIIGAPHCQENSVRLALQTRHACAGARYFHGDMLMVLHDLLPRTMVQWAAVHVLSRVRPSLW